MRKSNRKLQDSRPIGRPHELSATGSRKDEYHEIKRLWNDDRGVTYISKQTGISRQAIYNLIDREGWAKGSDSK